MHPSFDEVEEILLGRLVARFGSPSDAPAIFIVGSPRTGSTRLYQAMARFLRLPYFSNFANDVFPSRPMLALVIQKEIQADFEIELTARYGKSTGTLQPSEASAILTHWCGGGHPSAVKSPGVLPEKEAHMTRTVAAIHALFGAPLVTKNPWNCFRIPSLARLFPKAHFVWVRRDIAASALSDLASRYVHHADPNVWNSATPANVEELLKLPYVAQVVENQFEFARSIRAGLTENASDRHQIVWFEEFVREPRRTLGAIADGLRSIVTPDLPPSITLGRGERSAQPFVAGDEDRVRSYVRDCQTRLSDCIYSSEHDPAR